MNPSPKNNAGSSRRPAIRVTVHSGMKQGVSYRFEEPFRVGRDPSCEIELRDSLVSRYQAEFWFLENRWWVIDLQSGNGTFVNGIRAEKTALSSGDRIAFGPNGPALEVEIEAAAPAPRPTPPRHTTVEEMRAHYLEGADDREAGEHTVMIRQAFRQIQKRQKTRYVITVALLSCLVVAAGTVAWLKHRQVERQKRLAEEIFYTMKSMELDFAPFLKAARERADAESLAQVQKYREQRRAMEDKYERFLTELEIYEEGISPEKRLILQIARAFGECEIRMPDGFVDEVMAYVEKWKSSSRLANAVQRAEQRGYTDIIVETLEGQGLAPQFFYLGLQESGFDLQAVGPKTRFGIAKGIWQFIPTTGASYGLKIGPLKDQRLFDPLDERHHFSKSTRAAASYLRDIYDTEAQASGLLVMASYNWGERRVIELIRKLPENPEARNFWALLSSYRNRIPQETYDYVFWIFSAAVIGENPSLFGFSFDNPLKRFQSKQM